MKNFKIIYMDGYDEVRELETNEVIFSTKLDDELSQYIDRTKMNPNVVDNVVNIWNKSMDSGSQPLGSQSDLDEYLLNEGECTQEERETIVESLYGYAYNDN